MRFYKFFLLFVIFLTFILYGFYNFQKVIICPQIISVQQGGNLGNCIFEYMSLFAVVHLYEEANLLPYCTEGLRNILLKVFQDVSVPKRDSNMIKKCYKNSYTWPVNEPTSLEKISRLKNPITLAMYSARYEEIIKFGLDNIKQELRFKTEHTDYSNQLLLSLKSKFNCTNENVTFVGMHYRGTDYNHHLRINYKFFKVASPPTYKYYNEAMNYFTTHYNKVIFILITVDKEWLKKTLSNLDKNNIIVVNPNKEDVVKDFVVLAHCNHSIINYGTFGTVAALLNRGITFVYNINIPLDHRGPTIAQGITKLLPNWHVLK